MLSKKYGFIYKYTVRTPKVFMMSHVNDVSQADTREWDENCEETTRTGHESKNA